MRLNALASYVPEPRIDAAEIVRAAGYSPMEARVFSRIFGINSVAVSPFGQNLFESLSILLDRLQSKHAGALPEAVIYTHGIPVQYAASAGLSQHLRRHPFLRETKYVYEVDQHNCAGLFWAFDIAGRLLAAGVSQTVAILAGDSNAALPLADRYIPGVTMLGDAFAGLTVDPAADGIQIANPSLSCHLGYAFGQYGSPDEMRAFNNAHTGFVRGVLDAVGFPWERGEMVLPHNINRLVWDQFCRNSGLHRDRLNLSLLGETGHCYTADPLILLDRHIGDGSEKRDATLLSVGLGGFVGGCRVTIPAQAEAGHAHP